MSTPQPRPHVLNEELFKCFLASERQRADRSAQRLAMLTLSTNDRQSANAAPMWCRAIDAVAKGTRGTDVIGWLERGRSLGIILHEVQGPDQWNPRELELRVRRELAVHLGADRVESFDLSLRVHSAPEHAAYETPPAGSAVPREPHGRTAKSGLDERLKRLFDVLASATLLVLLAPLLLLVAALVKLKSPGPVFFRQVRVGRMMKPFEMLKFRTMHVNADPGLHQAFISQFINSGGANLEGARPGLFKLANDPRITPIGALLRKTSLDELPQLWNVLRGDMSLVGPRPPLPYEVEQYKPWHTRRVIEATPGITGLWQVGGRSQTTFDDMVRLDLRYARARCLWTDIKILLATPGAVFSGKGAC